MSELLIGVDLGTSSSTSALARPDNRETNRFVAAGDGTKGPCGRH